MSRGGQWGLGVWSSSIIIPPIWSNVQGRGSSSHMFPLPRSRGRRTERINQQLVEWLESSYGSFQVSVKVAKR